MKYIYKKLFIENAIVHIYKTKIDQHNCEYGKSYKFLGGLQETNPDSLNIFNSITNNL